MSYSETVKLRITLSDLDPAPWREVEIRLSTTLKTLHETIQAAFCWYDCHLWEFDVAGKRYGPDQDMDWGESDVLLARNARLGKLLERGVTRFEYVYDFGDDWHLTIDVGDRSSAADDERLPRFIAGEHRAPPEDIGGVPGFEYFLEVLKDPDHPDREEYENLIDSPVHGPFDPRDIQHEILEAQMSRVARRKAVKSGK